MDICIIQDGHILYQSDDNFLPALTKEEVLGAKAFDLTCDCGGRAKGLSGWVGQALKMRVKCTECNKEFFIEKKFPSNTLQCQMHYLQQKTESKFIAKYQERLEYKPEKKAPIMIEQKDKGQVIEVDFKPTRLLEDKTLEDFEKQIEEMENIRLQQEHLNAAHNVGDTVDFDIIVKPSLLERIKKLWLKI